MLHESELSELESHQKERAGKQQVGNGIIKKPKETLQYQAAPKSPNLAA